MRACLEATAPASGLPIAGLVLAVAAICDLKGRRIPNWLTLGAAACAFLAWAIGGDPACGVVLAGLAGSAAASPNLVRSGQVGAGDVKLAAALGALLGFADALALLGIGAFLALAAILLARARRGWRAGPRAVPLAPYLLGGFAAASVAGM